MQRLCMYLRDEERGKKGCVVQEKGAMGGSLLELPMRRLRARSTVVEQQEGRGRHH